MMKAVSIRKSMPHLWGAMHMIGYAGNGLCIHRAAGFVLDTPGAELCFGTFRAASPEELAVDPRGSTEPFIHAWAELEGYAYAPTTIEAMGRLVPIDRDYYYRINGARDIRRLSRKDVLRISGEIGLSAHLRHDKPTRNGASVGQTLMDAAGVRHAVTADGGIIPATEERQAQ